jgi:NADPH:quinone reductase-like Zn-dependent oxidoreductase
MDQSVPAQGLQLRSRVKPNEELELSLVPVDISPPAADQVVVRIEATPINPSDLGLLLGPADVDTARLTGSAERPIVTMALPSAAMRALAGRIDKSMPVGNEGAGVVIAAGNSPDAQALLGRTVAIIGGAMYAQYRTVQAAACLVLPNGTTAVEGASCFVNPLTSPSMVENMRREGHTALVHTAAASNLGQMLNKVCLEDGVGLVNIVRSPEQVALLRGIGAVHVCNSSAPTFMIDLIEALVATGATLAFDAVGGGKLASQILTAMEAAANRSATGYSGYGSTVHKQLYLYGFLDPRPTELSRNFGMTWGVGGWLLSPFLAKIGPERAQQLRLRVASSLKTTFASHYAGEISLFEALNPSVIAAYRGVATGAKYVINPSKTR